MCNLRENSSNDFVSVTSGTEKSKIMRGPKSIGSFKNVAWNFSDAVRLARRAIGVVLIALVTAWTTAVVAFTWWLSQKWTSWNAGKVSCAPWWCSPIAVDDSVKQYVGFPLFLHFGFRLYDSHRIYV